MENSLIIAGLLVIFFIVLVGPFANKKIAAKLENLVSLLNVLGIKAIFLDHEKRADK